MPRTWTVRLVLILGMTASVLGVGCGGDTPPTASTPASTSPSTSMPSLADALKAKADASVAKMPPELLALFKKAGDELAASDLMKQALTVAGTAPDFALPDGTGTSVSLATHLKTGPVVVAFYRGKW